MWETYEALSDGDRSALTAQQQMLFALLDLRREVNSGGFESYFRYWGGNTAKVALGAMPQMLDDAWACLLRDAMGLVGDPYPLDPDSRSTLLDADDFDDALGALDQRFFDLENAEDIDAKLAKFAS